jgi:hypothetical protein
MPVQRSAKNVEFRGFVQIELSDDDIPIIEEATKKPQSLWSQVADIVDDGYRFTMVRDGERLSIKASLMDIDVSRTSSGYMLTGEGPSPLLALSVLVYKHLARMNGKWAPFLVTEKKSNSLR